MPAIHEGAAVVANAVRLARAAHALGVPVIGTEQNPSGLGPNVEPIRTACRLTLAKTHFDVCAEGLVPALHDALPGCGQVVVAGCEAHVCIRSGDREGRRLSERPKGVSARGVRARDRESRWRHRLRRPPALRRPERLHRHPHRH